MVRELGITVLRLEVVMDRVMKLCPHGFRQRSIGGKGLFFQYFSPSFIFSSSLVAELNRFLVSSAVFLCLCPFKRISVLLCVIFVPHQRGKRCLVRRFCHWLVLIRPSSPDSSRSGPTRWGSFRWDIPCGRGTAPTWSRCRITGIWRWPRWRSGPLSLWRQWTR